MKINNFLDFILEAKKANTMRLYYSNKFREILKKMSDKSTWAKFLIDAEDSNQISDIYTLLDVTDKNDTISFIQVNRILRANPDTPTYTDDDVYFLNRKITNDETNDFWKSGRTQIGVGRWLRRIAVEVNKSSISDSELEKFVNLYKATFNLGVESKSKLELVEGEDIRKYYLEDNYSEQKGQLGSSCMKYKKCQPYLDIYVKNPEVCNLLILRDEENPEKIKGRALIWKTSKKKENSSTTEYFMDRIYTVEDSDKLLFQQWAKENGMDTYSESRFYNHYIHLQTGDFNKYPYMDTFQYFDDQNLVLTNDDSVWPASGYIKLQSTDGDYTNADVVWSEWHGQYLERDDAAYCEDIDDYMFRDDAIYLDYKNKWVSPKADVVYSDYHCDNYFKEDAVYSEVMKDWLYPESSQVIEIQTNYFGDTDWCVKSRTDLYIKVGDNYYSRKNYIKDPYSDEYHFLDEKEVKKWEDRLSSSWSDKLYHRILEDIIPKEIQKEDYWTHLRPEVVGQIKKIILENKFDKDRLINLINESEIFRTRIRGIYWGWTKEYSPEPEDMIPLIISMKLNRDELDAGANRGGTSYYTRAVNKCVADAIKMTDEKTAIKYKRWDDIRFMRAVNKLAESIENTEFGDEVYKRLVFIYM